MDKYHVDIAFNSHAILCERTHPIRAGKIARGGVRYVLVGGYRSIDAWIRHECGPLTAKISGSRPNYVRVAVSPLSLELSAIDCEGRLFDTLTIEK